MIPEQKTLVLASRVWCPPARYGTGHRFSIGDRRAIASETALVLAIEIWYFRHAMDRQTPTPPDAAEGRPALRQRREPRRFWSHAAVFAACVLLANGLFGERGLMDRIRARRVSVVAMRDLDRLKRDNAALREHARLLRDDPATIESVAREELGLARPGEILVTINDVK
jgi:cell division protein FtsB